MLVLTLNYFTDYARSLMTPPGIHINKTALAIICGLVFLAVLGFKYHTGSETVVSKFNDKNQGAEKFDLGSLNREAKKPLIGWQKETDAVEITKQRVTSVTKSIMQTQVIKEDWKKVDIDTVKIPDEIEKKVKELNVVQKTYKVMVCINYCCKYLYSFGNLMTDYYFICIELKINYFFYGS